MPNFRFIPKLGTHFSISESVVNASNSFTCWLATVSIICVTMVLSWAAFCDVITGVPVSSSKAFRATWATPPPRLATRRFSSNPSGSSRLDISVVVASASMVRTNSKSDILSRRFSFFNPFSRLYCLVVMPVQARVISSVRIAYSCPCSTPLVCHSDVNSLRIRIASKR